MSNYYCVTTSMADTCITLTTTYKDQQVYVVFLSSLVFGILLFILFLVLRFLLWEFGKQNIYHWGKDIAVSDNSDASPLSENNEVEFEVAREHSLFNWIRNYIMFGLNNFRKRVGVDAYLYQLFQLHLLVLMTCYVLICVVIILSVNVAVCSQYTHTLSRIGATSITACLSCGQNGETNFDTIWLHSIMTHVLVVIGLLVGLNYRRILYRYEYKGTFQFNAIQIRHLPSPQDEEEAEKLKRSISKHFVQTAREEEAPTTIDFVYDVAKYDSLHNKVIEAEKSLETYRSLEETYGVRQYIYTGVGRFVCWMKPVRAIDHFRHLITELTDEKEREKEKAISTPQGMVFVGFREGCDLFSLYKQYLLFCGRPKSSESTNLKQNQWEVSRAPAPSDVNWHNIRTSKPAIILWYLRWCAVNFCILVLLIFFTTPTAILTILNQVLGSTLVTNNATAMGSTSSGENNELNTLIEILLGRFSVADNAAFNAVRALTLAYAGPLLQILLASVIPLIVSYAAYLEFHWSKTDTMKATILKTYSFLLIMLLIFPSFSFTSFNILFEGIIKNHANDNQSIDGFRDITTVAFSPDVGIFFMNYLNISTFFVLIQIYRIPALFLYLYRKLSARNEIETQRTHDGYIYIFKFGIEYAWVLVKISIAIVYGTLFPLITVSGLLYLVMKMAVDRYNLIYQARRPREFSGSISVHLRALRFLHVSLLLSQFYILILSIILFSYRAASLSLLAFNSSMIIITTIVLTLLLSFRWFQKYIYDLRFSLKNLMTRSQEMHLIEAARYIEHEKHIYNYFDFIEMDKTDVLSDEARVV